MNNKIFTAISAIALALAVSTPASFAKVYTPSQFTAELKKQVGVKKGKAAYTSAAKFFQSALSDKKNSKNAEQYAKSIVSILKKPVPDSQKGTASNVLVSSLLAGYFKPVKFDLKNAAYNKALLVLLKILPASQKTQPVSQTLYNTIKKFALSKKSTQDAVFSYWNTSVAPRAGLKASPPVTS